MTSVLSRPRPLVSLLVILGFTFAILIAMGRPAVCTCGTVTLWGHVGPKQSQMLADWYSPSHIVHGFLFYLALRYVAPRWPVERRFAVALLVEAAWEIAENTPMVIDRYRAVTVSFGYSGDSVVNSLADIGFMALGFWIASKLRVWAGVVMAIAFELFTLALIRDNLTLNIVMLLWPLDAIRTWQAGG